MNNLPHRPILLMILDGWGESQDKEGNAVISAIKPNFDHLWQTCPHALMSASGLDVGLPRGQMGNSEVGHLNIGAGRRVLQDLTKIDLAIENDEFFNNPALNKAVTDAVQSGGALHILGLLSDGGVHSRNKHIEAMVELAAKRGLKKIYVHAFLDGRDTAPVSALEPIESMLNKMQSLGAGAIASISGRYYGMDRDKRWERVSVCYDLLTLGKADYYSTDAISALKAAYARAETDEFIKPTAICADSNHSITIKDGDAVVFMNFRSDRARELSYAFIDPNFTGFTREFTPKLVNYTTLTEYAQDLNAQIAYPNDNLNNTLGEVVANNNLTQLRIAETEKYAHVTYFINGGREDPFNKEDRILVQSPKVATYDLVPQMSVNEVTEKLITAISSQKYDLIICNYANADMVGHTGILKATIEAVEAVDQCLGLVAAALKLVNGEMVIIADHGNAEEKIDKKTGGPHTAHTTNPVPFIYYGRPALITREVGKLTDVAPTILYLMNLDKPQEMMGESMVKFS